MRARGPLSACAPVRRTRLLLFLAVVLGVFSLAAVAMALSGATLTVRISFPTDSPLAGAQRKAGALPQPSGDYRVSPRAPGQHSSALRTRSAAAQSRPKAAATLPARTAAPTASRAPAPSTISVASTTAARSSTPPPFTTGVRSSVSTNAVRSSVSTAASVSTRPTRTVGAAAIAAAQRARTAPRWLGAFAPRAGGRYVQLLPKMLWTAGYNARFTPPMIEAAPGENEGWVLRWDADAAARLTELFFAVQHLQPAQGEQYESAGCALSADGLDRTFLELPCADWGLMSMVRDVTTLVLEGVLRNMTVVQRQDLAAGCKAYCKPGQAKGGDTHIGCMFQPLSGCVSPYGPGKPAGLSKMDHAFQEGIHFYNDAVVFPPLMATLFDEGHIWWEDLLGRRAPRAPMRGTVHRDMMLGAIRAIYSGVVFRPLPDIVQASRELETSLYLPNNSSLHPMLVLHFRRTDKALDLGLSSSLRNAFADKQIPLYVYGQMARDIERSSNVTFRSVLILSDDLDVWANRAQFLTYFTNKNVTALINPHWLRIAARMQQPGWKSMGHSSLKVDGGDDDIFSFHVRFLADLYVAGQHADYLIGCGSSGVSQFLVQRIAARAGVEPSWLVQWEEDYFLYLHRRSAAVATTVQPATAAPAAPETSTTLPS